MRRVRQNKRNGLEPWIVFNKELLPNQATDRPRRGMGLANEEKMKHKWRGDPPRLFLPSKRLSSNHPRPLTRSVTPARRVLDASHQHDMWIRGPPIGWLLSPEDPKAGI